MEIKINGEVIERVFRVTSKFGDKESFRKSAHKGIDIALKEGTDIYSPVKGYVSEVFNYGNTNAGLGLKVKLENGQELIFGHCSSIIVEKNDIIQVGQKIAESGNTGFSTAPHLHIGLKSPSGEWLDPSLYELAFQKVYVMATKGQMVAADLVTQKSELYNTISGILQSFN